MTRTALYRAFSENDELLYIGITTNPRQRWYEHAASKAWWREVARTEVEWFDLRTEAAVAEAEAIRAETPRRNLAFPAEDGSSSFQLITPKARVTKARKGRLTPRRPAMKERGVSVVDDLWDRFGEAVEKSDPEADRSKVLRAFMRWFAGEEGAKLPQRPADQ